MTCAEAEILISDHLDGALHGAAKTALEEHLAGCAACGELAADAATAIAFMDRAATVDPPAELVTRILFEIPRGTGTVERRPPRGIGKWLRRWFQPILQPRFAMGMAMTILSFSLLGRFTGISPRQLRPSDLDPVKVWATIDDRMSRTWERTLKYYENLRLVYEIQSRLREWREAEDETQPAATPATGEPRPTGNQKKARSEP